MGKHMILGSRLAKHEAAAATSGRYMKLSATYGKEEDSRKERGIEREREKKGKREKWAASN